MEGLQCHPRRSWPPWGQGPRSGDTVARCPQPGFPFGPPVPRHWVPTSPHSPHSKVLPDGGHGAPTPGTHGSPGTTQAGTATSVVLGTPPAAWQRYGVAGGDGRPRRREGGGGGFPLPPHPQAQDHGRLPAWSSWVMPWPGRIPAGALAATTRSLGGGTRWGDTGVPPLWGDTPAPGVKASRGGLGRGPTRPGTGRDQAEPVLPAPERGWAGGGGSGGGGMCPHTALWGRILPTRGARPALGPPLCPWSLATAQLGWPRLALAPRR